MRVLLLVLGVAGCGAWIEEGELPFDASLVQTLHVEAPRADLVVEPSAEVVVGHTTIWRGGVAPLVSGSFTPDGGAGGLALVVVGCRRCRPDLDVDFPPDARLVLNVARLRNAELHGRTGSTFVDASEGVVEVFDSEGLLFVDQAGEGRTELHGVGGRLEVTGGEAILGEFLTADQVVARDAALIGLSFQAAPSELDIVQSGPGDRVVVELPAGVAYDLDLRGSPRVDLDADLVDDPDGRPIRISSPGRVEIRLRG